jgi:hypothetical protein
MVTTFSPLARPGPEPVCRSRRPRPDNERTSKVKMALPTITSGLRARRDGRKDEREGNGT